MTSVSKATRARRARTSWRGGSHISEQSGVESLALSTSVRRQRVLETIRSREFASVADLAASFGVSEVTIRAYLEALAEEGTVRRVRGGAIHRATVGREPSFEEAADELAAEKRAIGRAAAALVESGQTLILDALLGDASLFTRADEVEQAWEIVDPIIRTWAEMPAPNFPNYAAGTWGPEEADELIQRDDRKWRQI